MAGRVEDCDRGLIDTPPAMCNSEPVGSVFMASNLNHVMVAISDPTRRAILSRLARGPARISDVAAPFSMSLTGVCKHVRVLERAGLVHRTHKGRENTLTLTAAPLRNVAQWVS